MCFDRSSSIHRKKGPWGQKRFPKESKQKALPPLAPHSSDFSEAVGWDPKDAGMWAASSLLEIFCIWDTLANRSSYSCPESVLLWTQDCAGHPKKQCQTPSRALSLPWAKDKFYPSYLAWSYSPPTLGLLDKHRKWK